MEANTRPDKIEGSRYVRSTGQMFTWGPVVEEHKIGERIVVIEYLRDMSNTHAASHDEHGTTSYHVLVDGRGSNSFRDFDEAVVFAVALSRTGDPHGARYLGRHFIRGLETLVDWRR